MRDRDEKRKVVRDTIIELFNIRREYADLEPEELLDVISSKVNSLLLGTTPLEALYIAVLQLHRSEYGVVYTLGELIRNVGSLLEALIYDVKLKDMDEELRKGIRDILPVLHTATAEVARKMFDPSTLNYDVVDGDDGYDHCLVTSKEIRPLGKSSPTPTSSGSTKIN